MQSLQRATIHDCVSLSSHIGVLSEYPLRILFLRHKVSSRKKVQLCSANEQITGQTYIAANWDSKACPICQGKEGQDIRLIDRVLRPRGYRGCGVRTSHPVTFCESAIKERCVRESSRGHSRGNDAFHVSSWTASFIFICP